VYGAGVVGSLFLSFLKYQNVSSEKVIVFDKRYEQPGCIVGYTVNFPDFEVDINKNKSIVVIALSASKSFLISELYEKFLASGYKNIKIAEEVMRSVRKAKTMSVDNFYAAYNSVYQDDVDFCGQKPSAKLIAYYLPQFHEIPENSQWWGEGFTEWTNTKKSQPLYRGHYQPREPHDDIGYYDLSDANVIRKQASLAKKHGIYGWAIYYYWFSGKKFLTTPTEIIYRNKDIDINYCLCWCNEKWSKIWKGDETEVLAENNYSADDPLHFIEDLHKFMLDERYIRIEGKPVILVYQVQTIPDIFNVVLKWREHARYLGIGEIYVISSIQPLTLQELGLVDCFDAEAEFNNLFSNTESVQLVDNDGNRVSNDLSYYSSFVDKCMEEDVGENTTKRFFSVTCGFDNTPRYGDRATICDVGFSLEAWYKVCRHKIEKSVLAGNELLFVFAWNEWAESAYLEPDKKFGYAMINTLSRAVFTGS
jgi:hypothetical protein